MLAEDSGVRIEVAFVEADLASTRVGCTLSADDVAPGVVSAVLRSGPERSLPLLSVRPPRPEEPACQQVLEFAAWPADWDTAACLITAVGEPEPGFRPSDALPHTSDPHERDNPLTARVEPWLFDARPDEQRHLERRGWWEFALERPARLVGSESCEVASFTLAEQTLVLERVVSAPGGVLLTVRVMPEAWESESLLLSWLAQTATLEDWLSRCEQAGLPPWPARMYPRMSLRTVGDHALYSADVTGPWGPLQNRYHLRFPAVATPFVIQLEGVLGVPIRPMWSRTFRVSRFFEMGEWPVAADLGPVRVSGRLEVEVPRHDEGGLLICPQIALDDGNVDQVWIAGAVLEDDDGNLHEVAGSSTVWVDAEHRYRTGLSFPPVGDAVTLYIESIDVALRQPLESPVIAF